MILFVQRLVRPPDKFFHLPGRLEGRGRLEDDADFSPLPVISNDVVRQLLVLAAVVLVLGAEFQHLRVELLDVVFRERQVFPRAEDHVHRLGVAGDLLLVARPEVASLKVRQ